MMLRGMSLQEGRPSGDLTPELLRSPAWHDRQVGAAGIPLYDVPLVSVGGGIGAFTLVDVLRIQGVPAGSIRVLSSRDAPWQSWEYLTRVSQLPAGERIRSDAGARPDNIWGVPFVRAARGVAGQVGEAAASGAD